jgi:hypothetical protein
MGRRGRSMPPKQSLPFCVSALGHASQDDVATLVSSFTLSEPVAEEDFDAARYVKMIE